MSCDDFHCISGICLLCREKETGHLQGAQDTAVRAKKKEKRRRERSRCLPETCALPSPTPPPTTQSSTRDRENELEFRLQHIRLPASRLPLMRLDQGRSTGGFRAEGGLWSLYGGRGTSGQGCPMVGLHLADQCLVCGKPFPAADKQENTSANSSSSKGREKKKESGGAQSMSENLLVVGLSKMFHLLQCGTLFLFKMTSRLVSLMKLKVYNTVIQE